MGSPDDKGTFFDLATELEQDRECGDFPHIYKKARKEIGTLLDKENSTKIKAADSIFLGKKDG
jgi:hypothetical protein